MAGLVRRGSVTATRVTVAAVLAAAILVAGPGVARAIGKQAGAGLERIGARRVLPRQFFGFNAESIVEPVDDHLLADSAVLHARLAKMPLGILRIPGGTTSQWLDWRTGAFIADSDSPFVDVSSTRQSITMPEWAKTVRATDATPLWDLNVLTSTLSDQIAMLKEAVRLGMPVQYIELGNELWDPLPPYPTTFPTGAAYGTAMNPWIKALKRLFPHAEIAVSGADETMASTLAKIGGGRFTDWNASLLSTVRGENAITIHPYWGLAFNASPGSSVPATLTAGPNYWSRFVHQTLDQLPARMKVWLTEYNQTSLLTTGGTQIWAQALSVAAMQIDQLADPSVTISLLHDIVGGVPNPQDDGTAEVFPLFTDGFDGSRVLGRTSLGYTVPLIYSTIADATAVGRLAVHGVPDVGDQPGVSGVEVFGVRAGALLVNRTAENVKLRLPSHLLGVATLTTLSAPPGSEPGWIPSDHVTTATHAVHGSVTLAPYSVDGLALRSDQAASGSG
jgi:hypothetical protein